MLPLVKKYGAAVVAISNDETGISEDPDVRFEVAKKIVHRARDYGIPYSDIVVDPLVMPIGALGQAGRSVFHLIRRLREELKVNTTCGASNFSFGLPNRHGLNAAFLVHADRRRHDLGHHQPAACRGDDGGLGADVAMGHDMNCMRWIQKFREPMAEGEDSARVPQRGDAAAVPDQADANPTPSSSSCPRAGAAASRWARPCSRRRAAWASTSIRSAAAAASAGAARSRSPRASSPSWG